MQIVIDIPEKDVTNSQEIMAINLHFIAGEMCECSYPYIVLPKGHGDLIERSEALNDEGLSEFHRYDDYAKMRNYLKGIKAVIEADGGDTE